MALDLSVPGAHPAVPLKLSIARNGSTGVELQIANEDGSAIDQQRAESITVFATPRIDLSSGWMRVPSSSVLLNGRLVLIPESERSDGLFFRAEEAQ
jgi:hypothetical protein